MNSHGDLRIDPETAAAVSEAMFILNEYGYARASAYFQEVGIGNELAQRMLLIRYDRRQATKLTRENVITSACTARLP